VLVALVRVGLVIQEANKNTNSSLFTGFISFFGINLNVKESLKLQLEL
jgi:hypothetical protein